MCVCMCGGAPTHMYTFMIALEKRSEMNSLAEHFQVASDMIFVG